MGVLNVVIGSGAGAAVECQPSCKKNNDNIFSPIKNKMKVLKKIKKRMGLAPRSASSCPGPNNLPPLQFHTVHGDNIRISRDGSVARRYESFCKGITFSARPVRVNERVCVKFLDISNNWSGVIRFGFTCNDPATLRGNLPKYACPDLTNKPGFWAKALNERYCYRNNVLFYYVTPSGDVHFGINGEEKGVFITDVDSRGPLWAVIDVYGNSTAIEFLDSRIYMFQQQQHHQQQQQQQQQQQIHHHHHHHHQSAQSQSCGRRSADQEIVPHMESLSINQHNQQLLEERPVPTPVAAPTTTSTSSIISSAASVRYNSPAPGLLPLPFHPMRGRNIKFSPDRAVANRVDSEFCQGYVFTPRPIKIGERLIIQILKTDTMFVGSLALGLTSCDPATLQLSDLPDDSDLLLDRPEYWVVSKDVASTLVRGDELCFSISVNGEVSISKNGGAPSVIMHIDQSLQLWAFLDVYGSTQSVRLFSHAISTPMAAASCSALYEPRSMTASASQRSLQVQSASQQQQQQSQSQSIRPDMIQINPGGTVLVVNLPPTDVLSPASSQPSVQQAQATIVSRGLPNSASTLSVPLSTLSLSSHSGSTGTGEMLPAYSYNEPIPSYNNASNYNTLAAVAAAAAAAASSSTASGSGSSCGGTSTPLPSCGTMGAGGPIYSSTGVDCTICFEKPIDSVLYMCGHMCMCYDCAIKQWRGIGGGHCPLCRAVIRDVIRTYKS